MICEGEKAPSHPPSWNAQDSQGETHSSEQGLQASQVLPQAASGMQLAAGTGGWGRLAPSLWGLYLDNDGQRRWDGLDTLLDSVCLK